MKDELHPTKNRFSRRTFLHMCMAEYSEMLREEGGWTRMSSSSGHLIQVRRVLLLRSMYQAFNNCVVISVYHSAQLLPNVLVMLLYDLHFFLPCTGVPTPHACCRGYVVASDTGWFTKAFY